MTFHKAAWVPYAAGGVAGVLATLVVSELVSGFFPQPLALIVLSVVIPPALAAAAACYARRRAVDRRLMLWIYLLVIGVVLTSLARIEMYSVIESAIFRTFGSLSEDDVVFVSGLLALVLSYIGWAVIGILLDSGWPRNRLQNQRRVGSTSPN